MSAIFSGGLPYCHCYVSLSTSLANAGTSRDGDVPLFVCSSVCSFVCRLWNLLSHSLGGSGSTCMAASGDFSYRLQYTCYIFITLSLRRINMMNMMTIVVVVMKLHYFSWPDNFIRSSFNTFSFIADPGQSPPRSTNMKQPTHQRPEYQLHIIWCGAIITFAL